MRIDALKSARPEQQRYVFSKSNMKCSYVNFRRKILEKYGRFSVLRHGIWFVDIPRTSSSSIRAELGKKFGRAYGKRNIIEKEHATPQIFKDHIPAREMRVLLGNSTWNRIFTFTIVRNPWDRTYSMYNYRKKINGLPQKWCFRDYVLALGTACADTPLFEYHGFRYGASEYVLGDSGKIIVDFVARYENRPHDLNALSSLIKTDTLGGLCIQKVSPNDKHYSEFYDEETKEIIRGLYKKDIELFEYEFDDQT